MDGVWFGRLRWRRRGAWLWPTFILATVVDAVIAHQLPPAGDSESFAGAAVIALVLNLILVILLSRPVGTIIRRQRNDLPKVVARDRAGTGVVLALTATFLTAGLLHHSTVTADRSAQHDAVARAQAFIGDRAPARFRRNVEYVSTFAIEPGRIYRECVPSATNTQTYCVIVDEGQPFSSSVHFGGYEPNSLFGEGVN